MKHQQPVLRGLFAHPCGVWVAPYRMRSGAVWFAPLAAATRAAIGLEKRQ